jgi:hypothetical protein
VDHTGDQGFPRSFFTEDEDRAIGAGCALDMASELSHGWALSDNQLFKR